MPVDITTYELRDGTGQRAASEALGYDRARYYWEHGSRLVIISESEDAWTFANADVVTGEIDRERATAGFALEGFARWVETRRLIDDSQGKSNTRIAFGSEEKA